MIRTWTCAPRRTESESVVLRKWTRALVKAPAVAEKPRAFFRVQGLLQWVQGKDAAKDSWRDFHRVASRVADRLRHLRVQHRAPRGPAGAHWPQHRSRRQAPAAGV